MINSNSSLADVIIKLETRSHTDIVAKGLLYIIGQKSIKMKAMTIAKSPKRLFLGLGQVFFKYWVKEKFIRKKCVL
jgi:hypothetical protein